MIKIDNFKEEILTCIKELNLQEEIKLSDIPNLDLYMDQVITLFENGLNNSKRNQTDKILTKTMINNYTKDKILMPAVNKKYTTNHIIMMILIYNLKQSLSINDIKLLLNKRVSSSDNIDEENINLKEIYQMFLNINNSVVTIFEKEVNTKLDSLLEKTCDSFHHNNDYEKLLLTVLALINSANIQKRLAEKIIDKFIIEN